MTLEKQQLEEQYQAKSQEIEKKASFFETLYRDSTIERALQDAAVKHEAFEPFADRHATAALDEDDGGHGRQDRQAHRQVQARWSRCPTWMRRPASKSR